MAVEIAHSGDPSRQMTVNTDGSINTKQIASETITDYYLKNEGIKEVLGSILKELKKIELHLSILTDNTIKNSEVE